VVFRNIIADDIGGPSQILLFTRLRVLDIQVSLKTILRLSIY